jgi:hypothetical protein
MLFLYDKHKMRRDSDGIILYYGRSGGGLKENVKCEFIKKLERYANGYCHGDDSANASTDGPCCGTPSLKRGGH